ncbi:hypothetical protein D3C76_1228220 [compost metagenome]
MLQRIESVHLNAAFVIADIIVRYQSIQRFAKRGFAAAVPSDHGDEIAALDLQGNSVQHRLLGTRICKCDPFHDNDIFFITH